MEFRPKDVFHKRYVLKQLIGRGYFGEVWLSYDTIADIDVALKIYIALDNRGLEDFRNEYCSVFNIAHPNVLSPMHFDVWNKCPYLVMYFCPISAETLIGKLTEEDIWKFIDDVSKGLSYLHEQDIIHRDIKPDNILKDSNGRYVLTDFGLSKRMHASFRRNSTRTHQEDVSGSLSYMGPELFDSNPKSVKATDIWALGVTIYEMLTGELPFMGQGGILLKNGADVPELPNTYSYGLRKLVHDCLEKNPWNRPTAAQLTNYKELKNPTKEKGFIQVLKSYVTKGILLVCLVLCSAFFVVHWVKRDVEFRRQQRDMTVSDTTVLANNISLLDSVILSEETITSSTESIPINDKQNDVISNGVVEHSFVDLGLSVLWSTCNVGANTPEDYGDYYAWGEINTKESYTQKNYKWHDTSKTTRLGDYLLTKYNNDSYYGKVDNKSILDADDDVATVQWGKEWRIPTYKEWNELRKNCSWKWVTKGDKCGYEVRSRSNNNTIFIPAAGEGGYSSSQIGHYWASTIDRFHTANSVDFDEKAKKLDYYAGWRFCGYSIRPVRSRIIASHESAYI